MALGQLVPRRAAHIAASDRRRAERPGPNCGTRGRARRREPWPAGHRSGLLRHEGREGRRRFGRRGGDQRHGQRSDRLGLGDDHAAPRLDGDAPRIGRRRSRSGSRARRIAASAPPPEPGPERLARRERADRQRLADGAGICATWTAAQLAPERAHRSGRAGAAWARRVSGLTSASRIGWPWSRAAGVTPTSAATWSEALLPAWRAASIAGSGRRAGLRGRPARRRCGRWSSRRTRRIGQREVLADARIGALGASGGLEHRERIVGAAGERHREAVVGGIEHRSGRPGGRRPLIVLAERDFDQRQLQDRPAAGSE